jgi:hypothetical protein
MLNKFKKLPQVLWDFMESAQPTWPLAFFRIGLGSICVGKMIALHSSFTELYGQYGFIQWTISKFSNYGFLPHLGDLSVLLTNNLGISSDNSTLLLLYLYYTLCTMLITGLFTRLTTIALFFLHLAFINTGSAVIYGVDVFTQMSLFYGIFFPLGSAYALDNKIGITPFRKRSVGAGIALRCIQIQMCLVYFSTSIEKSMGIQWWNGEAIWRTFMMPIFKTYDFSWLANHPWIPIVTGIFVLILEAGYTIAMWIPKLRVVCFFLITFLHLQISVFMGMWFFGFVMIFLSSFAFGHYILKDLSPILYLVSRRIKSTRAIKTVPRIAES